MMTIYWAPARAKSLIRPPTAGSVGGWQLSTESRSRTCYHPKTAISQDQPIFHDWRMRRNKRLIFLPCSATFQKSTRAPHGTASQFSSFPPPHSSCSLTSPPPHKFPSYKSLSWHLLCREPHLWWHPSLCCFHWNTPSFQKRKREEKIIGIHLLCSGFQELY